MVKSFVYLAAVFSGWCWYGLASPHLMKIWLEQMRKIANNVNVGDDMMLFNAVEILFRLITTIWLWFILMIIIVINMMTKLSKTTSVKRQLPQRLRMQQQPLLLLILCQLPTTISTFQLQPLLLLLPTHSFETINPMTTINSTLAVSLGISCVFVNWNISLVFVSLFFICFTPPRESKC